MSHTPDRRPVSILLASLFILSLIYGCASPAAGQSIHAAPTPVQTLVDRLDTATPLPAPEVTAVSPVPPAPVQPHLWVNPALPQKFREQLSLPAAVETSADRASANLWLEPAATQAASLHSAWVYALTAPFPTLTDDVRQQAVQSAWKGGPGSQPLLMTSETRDALEGLWGPAGSQGVQIVDPPASLLDAAWAQPDAWAIVPFDELEPRWKVLRIEGQSPLDKTFDPGSYPLTLSIQLSGTQEALRSVSTGFALPSNRDPEKLTVLVMTGVTALSRHIGEKMEAQGLTYPAQDIGGWLTAADLTHISNEVSFYEDCPKPGPERADMRFCSSPKYIKLLEAVGTDIVELTGNHILDWGTQPFIDTLEMYQQRGWKTYGGGANLEDANKPLTLEHNGNRLVFLGCSPSGPEQVWATADRSGSAPCDLYKLEQQIRDLRAEGYLPIVTFQAVETDTYLPPVAQGMPDFRRMARAGAVIVSGSQSHVPQTMTFVESDAGTGFVHYGLGNLFFDQMKPEISRQEFIDQHVFYNGKYLGR